MTSATQGEASPEGLASALMGVGALTSDLLPAWRSAPRHLFVPQRIWPGVKDGTRQGGLIDRQADPDGWWQAVYSDIPLTTQWDDGRHQGDERGATPSSSSSMPSMVAGMLADLDVTDGCTLCEIGTGPGWLAAIASSRLGDLNVVTIETDRRVAAMARAALGVAGLRPLVVCGDGRDGYSQRAPYDRLVATCSITDVPHAWVRQTRPGGVIVAPYGTEYGGEFIVRLVVGEDGTAHGRFTRSSAYMRLRQQRTDRPPFAAYLKGEPWPAGGDKSTTELSAADTGGWLAQWAIGHRVPGAFWRAERYDGGAYTLWLYARDTASWATCDYEPGADTFEVVQSGPRRLWDEVEGAYRRWESAGRPGFDRFGLTVTPTGERVWLDDPEQVWSRTS